MQIIKIVILYELLKNKSYLEKIKNLNQDQLKELCKLIGKPEKPKQIPDLEVIESRLSSTDDIYIKEKLIS